MLFVAYAPPGLSVDGSLRAEFVRHLTPISMQRAPSRHQDAYCWPLHTKLRKDKCKSSKHEAVSSRQGCTERRRRLTVEQKRIILISQDECSNETSQQRGWLSTTTINSLARPRGLKICSPVTEKAGRARPNPTGTSRLIRIWTI